MPPLNHIFGAATCLVWLASTAQLSAQTATSKTQATADAPLTMSARVNADAAVLHDFQARVTKYVDLRNSAAKKSPLPQVTSDTAKIQAARETFAATIQSLRKDAQAGDIFTPPIQAKFRALLAPQFKGRVGVDTKELMSEDAAQGVPLKVNAKYPEKATVTTMAPNVLKSLPVLPKDLEYRVVGRALILRDVDANLIVDFVPNALATAIRPTEDH